MKVLILSCNTGGGHNAAASAMRDYLVSRGADVTIKDALAFRYEMKSKIISRGHVFVYKNAPKLFGAGYRYFEEHPPKKGQSLMYDTVKNDAEDLYTFLQKEPYDRILCTHLFAAMIVTEMEKRYAFHIKNDLIITDYTCYPGVSEIDCDHIFIPHEKLIPEFTEYGVPPERIIPSGIPVRSPFYEKGDPQKAKRLLGLPENSRIVLMMCGSMGCGPLPELASMILERLPRDAMLAVICGSNTKLLEKFQKMKDADRMHMVGFTDQVSLYMDAADVIMTKPGGLSATEAAIKCLPMVLINAVPGCETKNMDFFICGGYAVTAEGVGPLSDAVISLLSEEERRAGMSERLAASFPRHAAQTIGECILSEVQYIG